MLETFESDNPITASLLEYEKAKQIYTEGPEGRVSEWEIGWEQTEEESHTGGRDGSRGFPCHPL